MHKIFLNSDLLSDDLQLHIILPSTLSKENKNKNECLGKHGHIGIILKINYYNFSKIKLKE